MINLTPTAIHEINRLHAQQPNQSTIFRLGVKAGGCCQFSYTMAFDLPHDQQDKIIVLGDMQVVINQDQINYVEGLTIDYSEDLMGGGFRFNNPKAINTCSCGNSFTI